jgi:hypothetical protein
VAGSSDNVISFSASVVGPAHIDVRPGTNTNVPIAFVDNSFDHAGSVQNPYKHTITFVTQIVSPKNPNGWAAHMLDPALTTAAGQAVEAPLIIQTLFSAQTLNITVDVNATMIDNVGDRAFSNVTVVAQILPFYFAHLTVLSAPQTVSQDSIVQYQVEVANQATYPDWFLISTNATNGFTASFPPRLYVEPESSMVAPLTIEAPITSLYDLGRLGLVQLTLQSQSDPAVRYEAATVITVQGFYLPDWWSPLAAFAVLGVVVGARGTSTRRAERRLRAGGARRPRLSARQKVLLRALKEQDPAAYAEKKAELRAIFRSRRAAYRHERREARRAERAIAKRQHAEARAEKARDRADRKERRRIRAAEVKAARAHERELEAREQELETLRKKTEKIRAKQEEKQAIEFEKAQELRRKELERTAKSRRKELEALRKEKAREARKAAKSAGKEASPPEPSSGEEERERFDDAGGNT